MAAHVFLFQIIECRILLQNRIILYGCERIAFFDHYSAFFFVQSEETNTYTRVFLVLRIQGKYVCKQVIMRGNENLQV